MLNLSCGGGHLGFLFDAKNLNVVIHHPITIIYYLDITKIYGSLTNLSSSEVQECFITSSFEWYDKL